MNLFNKWYMRSTGERKFQPTTKEEKVTFAMFDLLFENKMLKEEFDTTASEEKLNEMFQKFHDQFQRTLSN